MVLFNNKFYIKKSIVLCCIIYIISFLFSCKSLSTYDEVYEKKETKLLEKISNDEKVFINDDYSYIDTPFFINENLFNKSKIIFPKNQTNAQMLSVVVINDDGKIIIFDGGRVEDAKYLKNIILNNGGVVDAWFITHIHDDHIGALYQILNDKEYDITIKNLYYNFADFDWYFSKMGEDAGIYILFEKALSDYNADSKSGKININRTIKKDDNFDCGNIKIEILNDLYLLNQDPINNTSIVYKVYIDDKTMLIFGDLGYEGSHRLLNSTNDKLASDICVLSHHGQNGVDVNIYKEVAPRFLVWPTSKSIYENKNGKYKTDETKNVFKNMNIKNQILTYEYTAILT